jgi:hypothetical protein
LAWISVHSPSEIGQMEARFGVDRGAHRYDGDLRDAIEDINARTELVIGESAVLVGNDVIISSV